MNPFLTTETTNKEVMYDFSKINTLSIEATKSIAAAEQVVGISTLLSMNNSEEVYAAISKITQLDTTEIALVDITLEGEMIDKTKDMFLKVFEKIKAFFIAVIDKIKKVFTKAFWSDLWETIKNIPTKIKNLFGKAEEEVASKSTGDDKKDDKVIEEVAEKVAKDVTKDETDGKDTKEKDKIVSNAKVKIVKILKANSTVNGYVNTCDKKGQQYIPEVKDLINGTPNVIIGAVKGRYKFIKKDGTVGIDKFERGGAINYNKVIKELEAKLNYPEKLKAELNNLTSELKSAKTEDQTKTISDTSKRLQISNSLFVMFLKELAAIKEGYKALGLR